MTTRVLLHQAGEVAKGIILIPPLAVITLLIIAGVFIAKLFGADFEKDDHLR